MDKLFLKQKLDQLGVNVYTYSLDGTSLPGRLVLYENYGKWEVFYFDERGNRDNEKIFYSESDACQYIYDKFKWYKDLGGNI